MYFLLLTTLLLANNVYSAPADPLGTNIVGGQEAKIEDYNYQVALIQLNVIWCGGSILTNYYVLTAGHCVHYALDVVTIRAGSSLWASGGSLHHVESNFTYVSDHRGTDIGIFRVTEPFVFDNTRQPVVLATPDKELKAGVLAAVSGWGTFGNATFPDNLWAVDVPIVDKATCNAAYNKTRVGAIVDGQICAGIANKDSCQGDSGGPLVVDGVQYGIVSQGYGCGIANYPGIYTDVAYYHDWITKTISQ